MGKSTDLRFQRQEVGVAWDAKERTFFRFGGLLTTADEPSVAQFWTEPIPATTFETHWVVPGSSHPSTGGGAAAAINPAIKSTSTVDEEDKMTSTGPVPPLLGRLIPGLWSVLTFSPKVQACLSSACVGV